MILVIAFLLAPPTLAQDNSTAIKIDKRSYQLGGIGAFSEMVGVGLKKLALGSPVPSAELDILFPEIEMIAANNGVKAYREDDFLVTDLFDEGLTKGLSLPIIYKGDTLKEYLDLKIMKKTLIATGGYTGENRKEIARQMGRLLSYPETRITSMLNK
jgi:hypothetical protein